jgi:exodeoxyribonuclease V alpha subunit
MCIKNKSKVNDNTLDHDDDTESTIYNGDIGKIVRCNENEHEYKIELLDTEEVHTVSASDIELAYAITIHKSQGSEFDTTLIILHPSHGRLLNRNLLYTAITRAKRKLIIISTKDTFRRACETKAKKRHSLLWAFI